MPTNAPKVFAQLDELPQDFSRPQRGELVLPDGTFAALYPVTTMHMSILNGDSGIDAGIKLIYMCVKIDDKKLTPGDVYNIDFRVAGTLIENLLKS